MKSKEEVEAILADPGNEKRLDMLRIVMDMELTEEKLACILVGIVDTLFPSGDISTFENFIVTMQRTMEDIEAELEQLKRYNEH